MHNALDYMKKLSLRKLIERFGQSFKRFPLAMLFTLFLGCFLIFLIHGGKVGDKLEFFLVFYFATGALLAVALSLLTEDFKKRWLAVVLQVVIHAAWLGVSVYLSRFDRFSLPQMISVSATVAAIGLAVFLICFYRRNQDVPFWNFSIRTLAGLIGASVICGFLTLGLFALVESLKLLFDFHITDKVFGDIASVCMVMLAPGLFMNLIPAAENKYMYNVQEFSRFSKGVVQYLFIPLLGLYMITLYAYGIKILLQWSLPVGGVSYLVTGSMVLMVLLIYLTYPIQHLEGNTWFKRVTRWLPVAMLPLLALMTVAIGRRLSDYGITMSRLYLLVFNVWCYAVCLWLIFTRNKRIWLIPASFAVILFIISVGPQSISNITQRQLNKEVSNAFMESGIKQLPLSGEQYEQWLNQADPKVAKSIDSKLHYLNRDYGYQAVSGVVARDVIVGRYSPLDKEGDNVMDYHETFSNNGLVKGVTVPQGYSMLTCVRGDDDNILKVEGNKMWVWIKDGNEEEYQFELDVEQLVERDTDRNPEGINQPLLLDNGKAVLIIDDYYITVYNHNASCLNFSGILFTK